MAVQFSIIKSVMIQVERILILLNPWCLKRDVKLEYKVLKEKIKEFNKKDAKFYGNMFAKLNKPQPFDTNVSFLSAMPFLCCFHLHFLILRDWIFSLFFFEVFLTLIWLNFGRTRVRRRLLSP